MPISSSVRKAGPFSGAGTTATFPFAFKVFQTSDLYVVRLNVSTGVETVLTINSDYTVSLNADQDTSPGGNVVLSSVLATGYTLVVTSAIKNLQPTNLTNQGGFYPTVINDALDRVCIQMQQLAEDIRASIKYPVTDESALISELPSAATRSGKYLVFDDVGNITVTSSNIEQLANQATSAAAGASASEAIAVSSAESAQANATIAESSADAIITTIASVTPVTVSKSGNGTATQFDLGIVPFSEDFLSVYISGVYQHKSTFSLSGGVLTFSSAPPSGTNNIEIIIMPTTTVSLATFEDYGLMSESATSTDDFGSIA